MPLHITEKFNKIRMIEISKSVNIDTDIDVDFYIEVDDIIDNLGDFDISELIDIKKAIDKILTPEGDSKSLLSKYLDIEMQNLKKKVDDGKISVFEAVEKLNQC